MGRPNGVRRGPLEPAEWPAWVLAFSKGFLPNPALQAARRDEFHQWQRDRDAWFIERGIEKSVRVCNEEQRRRARSKDSHNGPPLRGSVSRERA